MEKLMAPIKRAVGNLIYYIQRDEVEKYKAEVERMVDLIGKAYADGELELPGEEWRGRLEFGPTRQVDSLVVMKGHLAIKDGDVWEVIAHRLDRIASHKEKQK